MAFFIILDQLEDSILEITQFFPLKYIWDKQYYCILFGNTVDPEQLVSDEAV